MLPPESLTISRDELEFSNIEKKNLLCIESVVVTDLAERVNSHLWIRTELHPTQAAPESP